MIEGKIFAKRILLVTLNIIHKLSIKHFFNKMGLKEVMTARLTLAEAADEIEKQQQTVKAKSEGYAMLIFDTGEIYSKASQRKMIEDFKYEMMIRKIDCVPKIVNLSISKAIKRSKHKLAANTSGLGDY